MPIYKMQGKKDGKQQYRVRINFTSSDGNSKQLDRVAYGLAEAKELEKQLAAEIKELKQGVSKMTVQQLYDEYITVKKHEVRASTLQKVKQNVNGYVLPYLKDNRLDRLNTKNLQAWKLEMEKTSLSVTTKKNVYRDFNAMLNYAVRVEHLQKNPLPIVGNFKDVYFDVLSDKMQYYTAEQFKKYIAVARESAVTLTDWGFYVFFCIAFYMGMRKGEINALKWTDVEGDVIHVRRSVAQKLKGEDIETPPKNKSSVRDLKIPVPLKIILDEHKARQKRADGFTEDFRVCGGIACLRDSSIDNKNRFFAEKAELPRIRIHDFRHSHASLLANEGINIQEIARRLGHSNVETTWKIYAHLYPREEDRALQILNKIV